MTRSWYEIDVDCVFRDTGNTYTFYVYSHDLVDAVGYAAGLAEGVLDADSIAVTSAQLIVFPEPEKLLSSLLPLMEEGPAKNMATYYFLTRANVEIFDRDE